MNQPEKDNLNVEYYRFQESSDYLFYPEITQQKPYIEQDFTKMVLLKPMDRKAAIGRPQKPWFLGTVTIIQVLLLILSMILYWIKTGSPIQINPFNYLIGPGGGVLLFNIDTNNYGC